MSKLSTMLGSDNSRNFTCSLHKDELSTYNKLVFEVLLEAEKKGKTCVLYTLVQVPDGSGLIEGAHLLVLAEDCIFGTLGVSSLDELITTRAGNILSQQDAATLLIDVNLPGEKETKVRVLEDPIFPQKKLLVFGAGHIALPLVEMASVLGYQTIVVDDRQELVSRDRFPHASKLVCASFEEVFDNELISSIDAATSIVIVTRGHAYDRLCLSKVIALDACFIGMIGSRNKVKTNFRALLEMGVNKEQLKRVSAPIGFDLKGQRPAEIALSILAEMVACEHGGSGERLSTKFKEEMNLFDE